MGTRKNGHEFLPHEKKKAPGGQQLKTRTKEYQHSINKTLIKAII
jgi:hypothetical protein